MKLKSKLTKEEFDALGDALKEFYTEKDGNYLLDTDDADELRNALTRTKEEKTALQKQLDDAKQKAAKEEADRLEAQRKIAEEGNDVAALNASWQQKYDNKIAELTGVIKGKDDVISRTFVDNVAHTLANDISTVPELLLPHIQRRLKVEIIDGQPTTQVLDTSGKLSAMTVDELRQEFIANDKYAAIITGSRGSGGGAGGNRGGSGATQKKLNEMTEAERAAAYKADPEGFNRMVEASRVGA